MWDVVVCTCQSADSAAATRTELQIRQKKGLLSKDAVLLAIDDPKPNIGSGSATLNALLCVAEHMAAKEKLTAVSEDALVDSRILILLLGATFPFSPCGHAFMPSPSSSQPGQCVGFDQTEVRTVFDDLMEFICRLSKDTPPGVWVASTDMLLKSSGSPEPVSASYLEKTDIVAMTVTSDPEHATLHGVCKLTDDNSFARIIHKGSMEQVKTCLGPENICDILAGIVYFNPRILGHLLTLHTMPPLDACTYAGLDNGAEPLSLSLFFELLVCLTSEIMEEDYVRGSFKAHRHDSTTGDPVHLRARSLLWKVLKKFQMKAVRLRCVEHQYLRLVASDVVDRYKCRTNGQGGCVINSIVPRDSDIGNNSVLINCHLQSSISVGDNCFLSGLGAAFSDLKNVMPVIHIASDLAVQEVCVSLGHGPMRTMHGIVMAYGVNDTLNASCESGGTYCNKPWAELFQRTGITENDLWFPNMPKTLLNARLFVASHVSMEVGVQQTMWLLQGGRDGRSLEVWRSAWRVSIAEITHQVNCQAEFAKLRDISFELQREKMVSVLENNKPESFLPFLYHSTLEKKQNQVLKTLDQVAGRVRDQLIVCRVYASIADMLSYMAREGGIRAGPAANVAWKSAFSLLEKRDFPAATLALAQERSNWINNGPDRIIRAARHYERAGQILTRLAVSSAREFITGVTCPTPPINQPITVLAPARIDLAGAWTDTPPQAFEFGGRVATLALTIKGEYPIRVTAQRISELKLVLELLAGDGSLAEKLELTELSHLANYSQPHAPGALLKAAFICTSIVEFPSDKSLSQQLNSKFGCGFKIQSMSALPLGSGLGTSSILGGAIMAALWRVAGQLHSNDSLIHAVLHLEQLLTTGGGWQDQCGGLYGGAKVSCSSIGLPVKITTRVIEVKPGFLDVLTQHLVLIYTGKTRLARNLLQDVLRNWHSREAKIVKNMRDIYDNAGVATAALEKGDLQSLGECLNRGQGQKVIMAPGSLPKRAAEFMDAIKDEIYGCMFAGAGGGGFIAVLTKSPSSRNKIQAIIDANKELGGFMLYEASVDDKGLHFE